MICSQALLCAAAVVCEVIRREVLHELVELLHLVLFLFLLHAPEVGVGCCRQDIAPCIDGSACAHCKGDGIGRSRIDEDGLSILLLDPQLGEEGRS